MTELPEMIRSQHCYNMIGGLSCDHIVLYDDKKKGFKPKYKWKDRKVHFEHKKREKELVASMNSVQKLLMEEACKPDVFNDLHGIYTGEQWDGKVKVKMKLPDCVVRKDPRTP